MIQQKSDRVIPVDFFDEIFRRALFSGGRSVAVLAGTVSRCGLLGVITMCREIAAERLVAEL